MKFKIYSRKSVFTGKGECIENQVEMCRDYIFANFPGSEDCDITVYEDEGFSGKNLDRPQFQRMMRDIKRDKPDCLVCYRLDRISRNVGDFAALIEELGRRGVAFVCIREKFDTGTPMGKAMMYIASVFAQLERETIAEDVYKRQIWGYDYVGDSATVTVHIGRIREKIEDNPSHPKIIETVWGAGYRLNR